METVLFEELEHFKILDDDIVRVTTNKEGDTFIVKNSLKQNHNIGKYRRLNKDEFINIETGEIRKFNIGNFKSEKSIRRSMNKLRELIELNFTNTNFLFITLTTANLDGFNDIKIAKKHFKKFIRKLTDKYKDIAYVAKFEQHKNGNWHIHLLVKNIKNKAIFIPNSVISKMWKNKCTKTRLVNKKDIEKVTDYMIKTTQLNNVPKDFELFTKSKNLRVKREKMTFKEFKEKIQDNYYKISQKGIIVRHILTNKILNLHKKMIFKKKEQKLIPRVLTKLLKSEVIIALIFYILLNNYVSQIKLQLKYIKKFAVAAAANRTTATAPAPDRKTNVQKLKAHKDSFFFYKRHKWSDFVDKNSYN